MMQGDQYRLPVRLKHRDGSPLTKSEVKELEVFIGQFRKTLSEGTVTFDAEENVFYVFVTQKETFMFHGDVKIQARVRFASGDVKGVNLGTRNFEASISKVVL